MVDRPVPQPDCPPASRITESVPMVYVADVDRSAEFYALLGFACTMGPNAMNRRAAALIL